jgi:primosomal protein N' (replication factor Y)
MPAQAAAQRDVDPDLAPRPPAVPGAGAHDYAAFAASQLDERRRAGLPPFSRLALLRAEAREADGATAFLQEARQAAAQLPEGGR